MRAYPEARRGDHYAAEVSLMHARKREMSCFFVPLAQIRRQGKNAEPTLEYSFVPTRGIEVWSAFIEG